MNQPSRGLLVIVRHGESKWNARGVWTGITDIKLDEKGHHEGAAMGKLIADIPLDYAFATTLIRTQETLDEILHASHQEDLPITISAELRERDYGDYTGKNKWEVKSKIGEDAFNQLRRNFDYPVPNGETLKQVYARVVPYYLKNILPLLAEGQNVLVSAHGNSIRALVKYIENISDEDIASVEMIFGQALIYTVDQDGHQATKSIRKINTASPPV